MGTLWFDHSSGIAIDLGIKDAGIVPSLVLMFQIPTCNQLLSSMHVCGTWIESTWTLIITLRSMWVHTIVPHYTIIIYKSFRFSGGQLYIYLYCTVTVRLFVSIHTSLQIWTECIHEAESFLISHSSWTHNFSRGRKLDAISITGTK